MKRSNGLSIIYIVLSIIYKILEIFFLIKDVYSIDLAPFLTLILVAIVGFGIDAFFILLGIFNLNKNSDISKGKGSFLHMYYIKKEEIYIEYINTKSSSSYSLIILFFSKEYFSLNILQRRILLFYYVLFYWKTNL